MKEITVSAIGDTGRRVVHRIVKKRFHRLWTIYRVDSKGKETSCERGGKTLIETKTISESILRCQRFTDIQFNEE